MLPMVFLDEPPHALQSTPDHAPSHRQSATPSPSCPVLTPISVHSTTTSEQNWETSPPAMNLSLATVSPAVISAAAVSPAVMSPAAVSPVFTGQSTPDYSLGSPMKEDSPELVPVLAPGSPSITPPPPTHPPLCPPESPLDWVLRPAGRYIFLSAFESTTPLEVPRSLQSTTFCQDTRSPKRRHREVLGVSGPFTSSARLLRWSAWLPSGIWPRWRARSSNRHGGNLIAVKSNADSCLVS